MGNRAECVELMLAGITAGVWVTPINWHLTRDEIAYVIADSGARVLFVDEAYADLARELFAGPLVIAGDALESGIRAASDAPAKPDSPAGGPMIYTSGTTGRPKGVKRHRAPTLAAARDGQVAYARTIGVAGGGAHLITGPCYHAAPLMFAVYAQTAGAPLYVMPRWDERTALAWIQEREIAHTHLVPTMFTRLLRLSDEERAAFSAPALRTVLHGAAPISRATKQRMLDWWGPVLVEYWGAAESGVITLTTSAEWLAHPETVGRVQAAWEVFATDTEGRRLPNGENGLLYARHRTTPRLFEYHGAPRRPQRAISTTTRSRSATSAASTTTAGCIWPTASRTRSSPAGVNIYPAEIEAVLQEHPAVADVAVFGIPDDEWGERVKAAIELRAGHAASDALATEILRWARERLAGYKMPRSIDFAAKLPRHASGKLYLRALRDPYWAGRSRKI
jgi:long-chain acyl-CoA synthetase